MPIVVDVKGVGEVEFPDGMSQEQIAQALQKMQPQVEEMGALEVASMTVPPQMRGQMGMAETALQLGSGMVAAPVAGLAGIGAMLPGGKSPADAVEDTQRALTYQPRSREGQAVSSAVGKPFELIDRGADIAGDVGGGSSPLAETAIKTALLAAPSLLFRGSKGAKPPPKPAKPPTTEALRTQATEAYQAAENAGVIVKGESVGGVVENIITKVADEGIDATLHPDSMAALNRLMDAAGKNHSLKGIDILRQVIKDAEASPRPADRRMAGIMRRELDDYVENLDVGDVIAGDAKAASAALTEARSLYARNRKAETIDGLIRRAEIRASQFSGSGLENAIRTEFRQLAMNEKKMRRFNPEEQAAIRRVAQGGPVENALRQLGKMAPTGAVSAAISGGAGAALMGPVGAVGLPLAGGIARQGATAMTRRNVRLAQELMRRGEAAPNPPPRGARQMAIADALAGREN